jgi:hypothetical protein
VACCAAAVLLLIGFVRLTGRYSASDAGSKEALSDWAEYVLFVRSRDSSSSPAGSSGDENGNGPFLFVSWKGDAEGSYQVLHPFGPADQKQMDRDLAAERESMSRPLPA